MRTILSRTIAAAAAMSALLLGCAAAPSLAAGSQTPVLSVEVFGGAVTPGQTGAGTNVQFSVADPTVREVQGLQVTVDTAALPPGVTVAPASYALEWNCTTSASLIACSQDRSLPVDWYAGATEGSVQDYLPLDVTVDPAAGIAAGSIGATATATGLNTAAATAPYSVAEPVKLVAAPVAAVSGPDGTSFSEQYAVTNAGTTVVHGVELDLDTGFAFTGERHSNCRYGINGYVAYCAFDNDLLPGESYTISTAQGFQIQPNHLAPFEDTASAAWRTTTDAAVWPPSDVVAGQGAPLSLIVRSTGAPAPALSEAGRPQTDQNWLNSASADVTVTGTDVADLAAVGGKAAGVVPGTPVTFPLGVRDVGPASADLNRSGDPLTDATVTVPAGTTATAVPVICAPVLGGQPDWSQTGLPGFATYDCPIYHSIGLNQKFALPFTFTPGTAQPSYTGSITIADDTATANNTAAITVKSYLTPLPG